MAKEYKNDVFAILGKLDKRQYKWYNDLTEEQVKELAPWQLQRWFTSDPAGSVEEKEYFIQAVNDHVNVDFNKLNKDHQQLQVMLLAMCGLGTTYRRKFVPPGKGAKKDKFMTYLSEVYPEYNDDELDIVFGIMDKKERKALLEEHGLGDKEIKELIK